MLQIDWQSGRLAVPSYSDKGTTWSLVVAGDWAPLEEHAQALSRDPVRFYDALLPILRDADLAVVNVEGVLGNEGSPVIKDGRHMRLPLAALEGLTAVPFHVACLANNHSMDFGPAGLALSRQLLAEKGMASVGAGIDEQEAYRPFVTQIKGVQLAMVNVAEGEEGRSRNGGPGVAGLDQDRLTRQIATLRQEVDVIVVIVHAGREFLPVPPPYVQRLYRALVEAGADWIVGHHPHVPQGIEVYQGRPIVYSVGNFALWIPDGSSFRRWGYLVKGHFRDAQLTSLEIVPYCIQANGLTLLTSDERAAFMDDLAQASGLLGDPSKVEAVWCAYADRWLERGLKEDLTVISSLLLEDADLQIAWLNALSRSHGARAKLARQSVQLAGKWLARASDSRDEQNQARGMAMLRNRFDTPAHRELYLKALERRLSDWREATPGWALDLLERWGVLTFQG